MPVEVERSMRGVSLSGQRVSNLGSVIPQAAAAVVAAAQLPGASSAAETIYCVWHLSATTIWWLTRDAATPLMMTLPAQQHMWVALPLPSCMLPPEHYTAIRGYRRSNRRPQDTFWYWWRRRHSALCLLS